MYLWICWHQQQKLFTQLYFHHVFFLSPQLSLLCAELAYKKRNSEKSKQKVLIQYVFRVLKDLFTFHILSSFSLFNLSTMEIAVQRRTGKSEPPCSIILKLTFIITRNELRMHKANEFMVNLLLHLGASFFLLLSNLTHSTKAHKALDCMSLLL